MKPATLIKAGIIGAAASVLACWLAIELHNVAALAVAFVSGVLAGITGAIGIHRLQKSDKGEE